MRPCLILATGFLLCAPGVARDREFDLLAQRFEARYGSPRTHIPMMGFANFLVKVARPGGASDFRLAVFENINLPVFGDDEEFTRFAQETLGPDWHPFVRTHERRNNQWTGIYSNFSKGHWKLLIVTAERNEATLVRLKLNANAMKHWIERPRGRARYRTRD
jgi:hypothetical protein